MSSIKHALMSAGREYWDEFTKVLQLQKLEVLAREEMLHLVSDLLESNHPELYAEFKRMVNEAVGYCSLSLSLSLVTDCFDLYLSVSDCFDLVKGALDEIIRGIQYRFYTTTGRFLCPMTDCLDHAKGAVEQNCNCNWFVEHRRPLDLMKGALDKKGYFVHTLFLSILRSVYPFSILPLTTLPSVPPLSRSLGLPVAPFLPGPCPISHLPSVSCRSGENSLNKGRSARSHRR